MKKKSWWFVEGTFEECCKRCVVEDEIKCRLCKSFEREYKSHERKGFPPMFYKTIKESD